MRQLVGLSCPLCQKVIDCITEGCFCPACGCPVHTHCAQGAPRAAGTCMTCGAPVALGVEHQRQAHEEAAARERDVRSYQGFRHIGLGLLWLIGGLGVSLFCFGLATAAGAGRFLVATGAIGVGLGQIIYGMVVLLRKQPPSA